MDQVGIRPSQLSTKLKSKLKLKLSLAMLLKILRKQKDTMIGVNPPPKIMS